jgi:hypothetical protein
MVAASAKWKETSHEQISMDGGTDFAGDGLSGRKIAR